MVWCLFASGAAFAQPAGFAGLVTARADFRPLSRAEDKALYLARRPTASQSYRRVTGIAGRLPDITGGRAGVRKAVPVTRGQELGLRFRPDEREPTHNTYLAPMPGQAVPNSVQSQFRPLAPRRKPTYEQMEAQRNQAVQPAPIAPFGYTPLQPPPLAPFGVPLRRW